MYIYIYIYIYNDLLWGIGLCDFRGWEVPWSASCNLKAQESQWCRSSSNLKVWELMGPMIWVLVWVRKPENKKCQCPRKRWLSPSSRKQICPSSHFFFCSGPRQIWWRPLISVTVIFTQFIDSNANLFQKHPHGHI